MAENIEVQSGMEYWRLCEDLTVIQAALLIIGKDPGLDGSYISLGGMGDDPSGFVAVKAALRAAILSETLRAKVSYSDRPSGLEAARAIGGIDLDLLPDFDDATASGEAKEPDWHCTTVHVSDLRSWLSGKELRPQFFFPLHSGTPPYLDPANDRYAPKLAAAVTAWFALADANEVAGMTPKTALTKWLNLHAAEFGLVDRQGRPVTESIKQAAMVANWKPKGGAPPTPGKK